MLTQLKSLAAQADLGSEIAHMIEEKTRDWYDTLTFDQKHRLKEDGLRDIVDELLTINGGSVETPQPREGTKAHKSRKPRKAKKPEEPKPVDPGLMFCWNRIFICRTDFNGQIKSRACRDRG